MYLKKLAVYVEQFIKLSTRFKLFKPN